MDAAPLLSWQCAPALHDLLEYLATLRIIGHRLDRRPGEDERRIRRRPERDRTAEASKHTDGITGM